MQEIETQEKQVLLHFAKHGSITSMDAFSHYGITRLSARIYTLREKGYDIEMIWEESVNRFGRPVRYGRYYLVKSPKKTLHLWK